MQSNGRVKVVICTTAAFIHADAGLLAYIHAVGEPGLTKRQCVTAPAELGARHRQLGRRTDADARMAFRKQILHQLSANKKQEPRAGPPPRAMHASPPFFLHLMLGNRHLHLPYLGRFDSFQPIKTK